MRRVLITFALGTLTGCGGDSSTGGTAARFPSVAGMYQVYGAVNSPPGAGQFSGPLAISQASRDVASLTGSASVSVTIAGKTERYTTISFGELADYGSIQLYLDSPTSSNRIHFRGQVDGRVIKGSMDITVSNAVYFGTFTATR